MKNKTTITPVDIHKLEEEIGFVFPDEYVEDICNRGTDVLSKNFVCKNGVPAKNEDGTVVSVKSFLSPVSGEKEAIRTIMCFTPKALVPFAFEPTGQILCFLKESKRIFIFNPITKTYMPFAENYQDFISELRFGTPSAD